MMLVELGGWQRSELLRAMSPLHLCKTIVLENTAWDPSLSPASHPTLTPRIPGTPTWLCAVILPNLQLATACCLCLIIPPTVLVV